MLQEHPNTVLARRLREMRRRRGWSQETMAEKCGLHRTYVGAIERGERNITLDTLHNLANSLGVSAAELISKKHTKRVKENSARVS
ncbi:MAG: helix-turn-helix transcriptional regulator [Acidobacteria bacterium]|nr:helix-turn-helix transcriptional regulator [Acidobacteriota bacterium]